MSIRAKNTLWFLIIVISISGCEYNPNKTKIESCLNTDLKDDPACELSYWADWEYPCESNTLFRINADKKYYHELVSKIGLIRLDEKGKHLSQLQPYDRDSNDNSLWMSQAMHQFDRRTKLSWWKEIDRKNLPEDDIAANYHYKDGGLIASGDKDKINGIIIMYYADSAIFGIINTGCTEPISN